MLAVHYLVIFIATLIHYLLLNDINNDNISLSIGTWASAEIFVGEGAGASPKQGPT